MGGPLGLIRNIEIRTDNSGLVREWNLSMLCLVWLEDGILVLFKIIVGFNWLGEFLRLCFV